MNKVILMGRLTRDPEISYSQKDTKTAIGRYALAVDRPRSGDNSGADFINCVTFGSNAEFAEKYLHKGTKILVEGRITTGSYTNNEGKKVYTTDVIVDHHEFCESKGNTNREAADEAIYASEFGTAPQAAGEGFVSIPDNIDEELPFG